MANTVEIKTSFPVYLECAVGGKNSKELITEIEKSMPVSKVAKDLMLKYAWKPGKKEVVRFARVKVIELGFLTRVTTREAWARIVTLGHALCKPADGPAIRLALPDQPARDGFHIAMEQITGSDLRRRVFWLWRADRGAPWLDARLLHPGELIDLNKEIVFRLN